MDNQKIAQLFSSINDKQLSDILKTAQQQQKPNTMFTCKDLILILKDTLRKVKTVLNNEHQKDQYLPMLVIALNNAKDLCSKATLGGNAMDDWLNIMSINADIENTLSDIFAYTQSDIVKQMAASREFKDGRRTGTLPNNTSALEPANLLRLNNCYNSIICVGKPKTNVEISQPTEAPNYTQIKYSGDYLDTAELVVAIQIIKGLIKDNQPILKDTVALSEMQMALQFIKDVYKMDDSAVLSGRKHKA